MLNQPMIDPPLSLFRDGGGGEMNLTTGFSGKDEQTAVNGHMTFNLV